MKNTDPAYYLSQTFSWRCSSVVFSEEDIENLEKYGAWLEALESGKITPSTDQQLHFLSVTKGDVPPETYWEKLWVKYTKRIKWEFENPHQTNTPTIQDPGEEWFPRDRARMGGLSKFFSK